MFLLYIRRGWNANALLSIQQDDHKGSPIGINLSQEERQEAG